MTARRIFIGWDPRQAVSFHVLNHSVIARASRPVAIAPLVLDTLPITRQGLTPFTFSRFLVPWLCGFDGLALFLDADMLALGDVEELFAQAERDPGKAVYIAPAPVEFERASLMLFDCGHPANAALTPAYIQRTTEPLHALGWCDPSEIGALPPEWNHCVLYHEMTDPLLCAALGVQPAGPVAKLVHFTGGVPAWPETRSMEYAQAWLSELERMGEVVSWATLMGRSRHVPRVEAWLQRMKGGCHHAKTPTVSDPAFLLMEGADPERADAAE